MRRCPAVAAEMGNFGRVALVKGPMVKTNPRKEGPKSVEWAKENWLQYPGGAPFPNL